MNINDRVINNIKIIMFKKKINQNKIAKILCQSRQAVSLCFLRKRNMTLENIEKLSNYFKIEIQQLLR